MCIVVLTLEHYLPNHSNYDTVLQHIYDHNSAENLVYLWDIDNMTR